MSKFNEKAFKNKFKLPICTKNPCFHVIPNKNRYNDIRNIKQECLETYGEDRASECTKRLVCFSKTCPGRSSFWDSKTALPYLNILKNRGLVRSDGDIYVEGCNSCSINKTCTYPCPMINDFMKRHYKKEPPLLYKADMNNYELPLDRLDVVRPQQQDLVIPWDCISSQKALIVRMYIYQQLDFLQIANKIGRSTTAQVHYAFYSALTTMSEVAIMRKFLTENRKKLHKRQIRLLTLYYVKNKNLDYISKCFKISKQGVGNRIRYIIKKYNIKWEKFVIKVGHKKIYKIPYLLK